MHTANPGTGAAFGGRARTCQCALHHEGLHCAALRQLPVGGSLRRQRVLDLLRRRHAAELSTGPRKLISASWRPQFSTMKSDAGSWLWLWWAGRVQNTRSDELCMQRRTKITTTTGSSIPPGVNPDLCNWSLNTCQPAFRLRTEAQCWQHYAGAVTAPSCGEHDAVVVRPCHEAVPRTVRVA